MNDCVSIFIAEKQGLSYYKSPIKVLDTFISSVSPTDIVLVCTYMNIYIYIYIYIYIMYIYIYIYIYKHIHVCILICMICIYIYMYIYIYILYI